MLYRLLIYCSIFWACSLSNISFAQPAWTLDPFGSEKKPEIYSEKKLPSEKTADKKYTLFRKFTHNNTTHYNYFFNANNKVYGILERARMAQTEDYTKLLPFYPYSLDMTAADTIEIDSVIYKATAGILLHDLRNDWIDDLYLLIGRAYYLRKDFDSAAMTFQFINYNLFPRKKNEDDSRVIGGNMGEPGSMFSIADKENRNLLQRILTLPPSRNDALIWLARTFVEAEEYGEATGIINILYADPNLPTRLIGGLNEVNAYWFYKQGIWDSCAVYLEKALDNAPTRDDKARWQYLLAQLLEKGGNFGHASDFYMKSAKSTSDPLMDIYAHLNNAQMGAGKVENNISKLVKMAKKDKYFAYRDIIFHAAGKLSRQISDTAQAIVFFKKSLKFNESNSAYRSKAFFELAELAYEQKRYKDAALSYDSIDVNEPSLAEDSARIIARKNVLSRLVELLNLVDREDSLQMIAAMSPAERDAFVKRLVKKYKKESGSAAGGEEDGSSNEPITFKDTRSNESADLFATSSKGEWYFYNAGMRNRGQAEFKSKWGKRPNEDNWRRKSVLDGNLKITDANIDIDLQVSDTSNSGTGLVPNSYDALMADVPLSREQLDSSRSRLLAALLDIARIFQNELLDYDDAVEAYLKYLSRLAMNPLDGEAYLGLYYCYTKLGDPLKAGEYKKKLSELFAGSRYEKAATDPSALSADKASKAEAGRYQKIYDLFLEGNFEEAIKAKKEAEASGEKNPYVAQLLFIEAVYWVKERKDSQALALLDQLIAMEADAALKEKARTMRDVVSRRAEIEAYLTNLDVTRVEEERVIIADNRAVARPKSEERKTITEPPLQIKSIPALIKTNAVNDSIKAIPSMASGGYLLQPEKPHFIVMVLNKVDGVYVNEVKNAFSRFNRNFAGGKQIQMVTENLDAGIKLLLLSPFEDASAAIAYHEKIKKNAGTYITWLQAAKYSYLIITENNLNILRSEKNLQGYKTLLNGQYPGLF
jgi:tetratricopeptide (TPR) repeat protein